MFSDRLDRGLRGAAGNAPENGHFDEFDVEPQHCETLALASYTLESDSTKRGVPNEGTKDLYSQNGKN